MVITSVLLKFHVVSGIVALATFAVPMVVKKGSKTHVRFGWAYVGAMMGVAVTAAAISLRSLLNPETDAAKAASAVFLLLLSLFTSNAVWSGIRVLRFKARRERHTQMIDIGFTIFRVMAAVLVSGYGLSRGNPLLTWFPALVVFTGAKELQYWLKPTEDKMHWWFQHMSCMFTACIGTVTAFVVTAVPRLLGDYGQSLFLWLAPAVVMVPILQTMTAYYRKKFGRFVEQRGCPGGC
jgi:uncharacterized membrane protein